MSARMASPGAAGGVAARPVGYLWRLPAPAGLRRKPSTQRRPSASAVRVPSGTARDRKAAIGLRAHRSQITQATQRGSDGRPQLPPGPSSRRKWRPSSEKSVVTTYLMIPLAACRTAAVVTDAYTKTCQTPQGRPRHGPATRRRSRRASPVAGLGGFFTPLRIRVLIGGNRIPSGELLLSLNSGRDGLTQDLTKQGVDWG